ncbi:hypothetical protein B0J13DRAFT_590304 [Dactylonectria estremocensis]|uniref:T6SS Phospholipase effector Tle1-like catalytic domain-containing protein n=1 Tax=Dactylonectria estremocensis TaxID=1079267 RepID=A0A9P9DCE0_9HYPO|nr:hypothetical protein B0J13DRAFT_590304 [Dactylonectria estremocensis]
MALNSPKLASYKCIILCADGIWLALELGDASKPSNVATLARVIASTGINEDGLAVYEFISNNYELGDELFFFSFLRGAFTVRSVAGLVCDVGVLLAVHMPRFAEIWQARSTWYRNHAKEVGLIDVRVKIGIPEWGFVKWLTKAGIPVNKPYAFHNMNLLECVDYAFQALAIDEKRLTFLPTIWYKTHDSVYGNIGGQADSPPTAGDQGEIGNNTLAWIEHRVAINSLANDRTPGHYSRDPGDGTSGATNEFFHPIVRICERKVKSWSPPLMQGWALAEPDEKRGWKWVRQGVQPLLEYVMRVDKRMSLAYNEAGAIKFKVGESLSRLLCLRNILLELDRDNGIVMDRDNGVVY